MAIHLPPQKRTIVRIIRRRESRPVVETLRPHHLPGVAAMAESLSTRSLYYRFFAGTPKVPPQLLRQLATLDHDQREAVVAVHRGRVIGLALYVRLPDTRRADLAVLVVDAWQHRGIGRRMVSRLATLAARRGITSFDASVLPENKAALRAVARLWPGAAPRPDEDCVHYSLPTLLMTRGQTP
ncbi:MAG: GNAT family N-acetyltransferase [Actinophytocola sp.]|nr:GNAT family N-acetyltransferase [Actinophytocola sp.]